MSRVVVRNYAVSLDGFGAGPRQGLENPLGENGFDLMQGFVATRTWKAMQNEPGGETGVDDRMAAMSMAGMGAWIMGRNMFAPSRGPWPTDDPWRGWWGEEPPYHCPVFVLTHHPRPALAMKGGTVFHFVTEGIEAALERARAVAGDRDIRIGGGAATVREYLAAKLIDELHLTLSPVLLGAGEPLWQGLDLRALGYRCDRVVPGERSTHLFLTRDAA